MLHHLLEIFEDIEDESEAGNGEDSSHMRTSLIQL